MFGALPRPALDHSLASFLEFWCELQGGAWYGWRRWALCRHGSILELTLSPAVVLRLPAPLLMADPCVPAAEWQVAEAAALVRALPGWSVSRTLVVPSAAPGSRLVFGKGNFRDLTGERYCLCGR